jgi:hypothetical protein
MQRFSAALLVLMMECANQRMAVAAEGDSNNHDGSCVGWAKRSVPTTAIAVRKGGHGASRLCPPYGVG